MKSDYKINVKDANANVYEENYEQGKLDYNYSYSMLLEGSIPNYPSFL